MKECRKRQVERRGDEVVHRCVHKKAETYRLPVCEVDCAACPLRVFIDRSNPEKKHPLPVLPDDDFPQCEYRLTDSTTRICGVTNLPVTSEICNRCAKDTKDATPNMLEKAISYASSVRKWVAAGKPERTQEEMDAIWETHCSGCRMYDKVKKVCNSCGCPASTDQPSLKNKLRMATEACPLGRFPAKVIHNA